ncbi:hypothetical protein E2C01_088758 [Portunus trituberculatus]|uniref:Uncharacterized protein n=1 Tax=Portunus trituberculatus TaxID=210409 RepID=A0A5B7JMS3_PORTR|nr:hypothetical protein [Portunus trituberculatus]
MVSPSLQLQLFGFNSQLYANFSQALDKAYGIVGISILLQVRLLAFLVAYVLTRKESFISSVP